MEMKQITEQISYIPATLHPLSADVGIIRCGGELWIFDVGASEEAAAAVNRLDGKRLSGNGLDGKSLPGNGLNGNGLPGNGLSGRKNIVLSHFHPDHMGNIDSVRYDALYAGAYTCRRLSEAVPICEHRYFEGGIHLFPLPSSHAKGCVGLEYGDYAFLGDGTYSGTKGGQAVYNAGLLRELILTLEALSAKWFLQSHREPFLCSKEEVLASLKEIYASRDSQSPYIQVATAG